MNRPEVDLRSAQRMRVRDCEELTALLPAPYKIREVCTAELAARLVREASVVLTP